MSIRALQIQPAVLADEWPEVVASINRVSAAARAIHIDMADATFTPHATFPFNVTHVSGKELPHTDRIKYEVHLMVNDPQELGVACIAAGCSRVVAQVEGFVDADSVTRACAAWREAGAYEVGLSILLDTPLEDVTRFLDEGVIEYVQIMSIAHIGVQGESFDDRALMRIRALRNAYPHVTIEVDGGLREDTLDDIALLGADVANVGSAIFGADDAAASYTHLCSLTNTCAN